MRKQETTFLFLTTDGQEFEENVITPLYVKNAFHYISERGLIIINQILNANLKIVSITVEGYLDFCFDHWGKSKHIGLLEKLRTNPNREKLLWASEQGLALMLGHTDLKTSMAEAKRLGYHKDSLHSSRKEGEK